MKKHIILCGILIFSSAYPMATAHLQQVPIEILGKETTASIEHAKRSIQNMHAFALQKKETTQDQALHQELDQLAQEAQALEADLDDLYTHTKSVERTQAKLETIIKKMREKQSAILKKPVVTSESSQPEAPEGLSKSLIIVAKNQEIEQGLDELDDQLTEAKKPSRLQMAKKLIAQALPHKKTLKKAAFIGAGVAVVGGIINAHTSPMDILSPQIVDENANALSMPGAVANSALNIKKRIKNLLYSIFGVYHKAELSAPTTIDELERIAQRLKIEKNINILETKLTCDRQARIIYDGSATLYKPGLYATPYGYFMEIQKSLSQQGSFGAIAASTAAKLFGIYHVAGNLIKPLAQKFALLKHSCGIHDGPEQSPTTEKLLEQFGIELTEETKKTLSPLACKAHINTFFTQRAIPVSQANTETLAYLFQIYPIGLINAFLEKSYELALRQPEKVTSDQITNDILQGMFHIKEPAQAIQNKTVAQVAGKLFGQFFFQDKDTPLLATTKNMVKISAGDQQKKPEMKLVTGAVVTTADLAKNSSVLPTGTEKQLRAEIKTLLAGKVAQENLGALIGRTLVNDNEQEGAFISSDEDEKAIHARCTALIMHSKGLNGQELTAGIQESIATEVGALKIKLKKEVLEELKLYSAQFDAIFWKLKNNPSLTPDMLIELKKECGQFTTGKSTQRSAAEKKRYERALRVSRIYQKMMQEATQTAGA